MTFFTQANPDARISTPGQIATGPRVGLLKGFQLAREMEIRSQNQLSAEYSFGVQEEENLAAMQALGMQRPKTMAEILSDVRREDESSAELAARLVTQTMFSDPARRRLPSDSRPGGISGVVAYLAGETDDPMTAEAVRRYDGQFAVLRDRPMGPTPEEFSARSLYEGAIQRGRVSMQAFDRVNTSTLGDVGIFVGGMVGFADPDTSPLVAATLPFGGFGRNIGRRIISEGLAQGALETGIMATGQFQARQRFNPDFSLGQAATEVLAAAAFGGAFQGVVEGGVAVGRRFFRDTKTDPGPTPEQRAAGEQPLPAAESGRDVRVVDILEDFDSFMEVLRPERTYGDSRLGDSRMRADLDNVAGELADFDGKLPKDVLPFRGIEAPRTDTAIPGDVSGVNFGRSFNDLSDRIETIDARARRVDPQAVDRFHKLTEQRQRLMALLEAKQSIEQRVPLRPTSTDSLSQNLLALVFQVREDLDSSLRALPANRANRARQDAARASERAVRDAEVARLRVERPSEADIRAQLETVNRVRARIAPVVMRAYAAARNEWVDLGPSVDALAQLDALTGRGGAPESPSVRVEVPGRTIPDNTGPPTIGTPDAPIGGQTARARTANEIEEAEAALREQVDAELETIRSQLREGETSFVINGQRIELDQEISLPTEDGGTQVVTVRHMLADAEIDDQALQAVTSCRIS